MRALFTPLATLAVIALGQAYLSASEGPEPTRAPGGQQLAPEHQHAHESVTRLYVEIPGLTLDQYAASADEIIRGVVLDRTEVHPEAGLTHTAYEVGLISAIKGSPPETFVVEVVGGVEGARPLIVPGAPQFERAQEVLLFLNTLEAPDGRVRRGIMGLGDGTYTIDYGTPGESRVKGLHSAGETLLSEFEERARRLVD